MSSLFANKPRIGDGGGGGGTGSVNSVNGKLPNSAGDVTISFVDVGASPTNHTHSISQIEGLDTALNTLTQNDQVIASTTTLGHVKVDGDTIKITTDGQIYADVTTNVGTVTSVNSILPDANGNVLIPIPTVYDALDSTDSTISLSANKGRDLAIQVSTLRTELENHVDSVATSTEYGHVKIDDTTIKVNSEGQLYSTNTSIPLNVVEIIDITKDYTSQDVTGAEVTKDLTIDLNNHKNELASETIAGHVMIQNFIDDNQTKAITPSAIKNLQDTIVTRITADETALSEHIANEDVVNGKAHVQIDNETIKVNSEGKIYAQVGTNLNVVETIDFDTTYTDKDVLGAEVGKTTLSTLNEHISEVATDTKIGHVKPDGTTITVDVDGTLTAVQGANLSGIHNTEIVLIPTTVGQTEFTFQYQEYDSLKHPEMLFLNTVKQLPDSYTLTKIDDSNVRLNLTEVPQNDTFIINITIFDGTLPNGQVGYVSKLEYTLTTDTVGQLDYDFVAPEYNPDTFAVLVFTNSVKMLPTDYTLTNVSGDTWRISVTEPSPSLERIFSVVMLNGQGASTNQGGGGGGESQYIHYGTNPPTDEKAIWIVD